MRIKCVFLCSCLDQREVCLYHTVNITHHAVLCRGPLSAHRPLSWSALTSSSRGNGCPALWSPWNCLPRSSLTLTSSFLAFSVVLNLVSTSRNNPEKWTLFSYKMELSLLNDLWIIIWWGVSFLASKSYCFDILKPSSVHCFYHPALQRSWVRLHPQALRFRLCVLQFHRDVPG